MIEDQDAIKTAATDAVIIGAVAASKKHKQTIHRIRTYASKHGLKIPSEKLLQKQKSSAHYGRAMDIAETEGVKIAAERTGIASGTIYRIMKRFGRKYKITIKRMGRSADIPPDWTAESIYRNIKANVKGLELQSWVASVLLNDMDPETVPEAFIKLVIAYNPDNTMTDDDLGDGLEAIGYPNARARAKKGTPSNYGRTIKNPAGRKCGWHTDGKRIHTKRKSRVPPVAPGWELMGWLE